MPEPVLLGYTLETVIAEKFESIVKLALVNTRMKDFYDLWNILSTHKIPSERLKAAIKEVFTNRKTHFNILSLSPLLFTMPQRPRSDGIIFCLQWEKTMWN